jgi:hypothetical protein
LAATGDREAARAAYVSALNILTEDMPLWRGRTLEAIGDLDADPAAWAAALELYRRVDAPEAAALEAKLNR